MANGFNPLGGNYGYSTLFEASQAGADITAPTAESGGMSMGAMMGWMQALTGLAASFEQAANVRANLKIKQIQNRINRRFAKAEFNRKMTGLFQAHRDLEEQSVQAHMQRQKAYQQKMGSLRVMQAERGMAGTSASETVNQLTRSNLAAEQILIKNMEKQQRALMYQREGIADARLAQELGFDMQDANIRGQLQSPIWAQLIMQSGQHALSGFNTYFDFVKTSGRSDKVTE